MSTTRGNAISTRLRAATVALKYAKPRTLIVTTPNVEYGFRFAPVGSENGEVGSPTQMGVFGEMQHVDKKGRTVE